MFKLGSLVRAAVLGLAVSALVGCAGDDEEVDVDVAAVDLRTQGGRVSGDGRGDIIVGTTSPRPSSSSSSGNVATGGVNPGSATPVPDANGDGKADLVVGSSSSSSSGSIPSNSSSGNVATGAVSPSGGSTESGANGDGAADIIVGSSSSSSGGSRR